MKTNKTIIALVLAGICPAFMLNAQITPHEAAKQMARGINIGNTLEGEPEETSWDNPLIEESIFDTYVAAGFTSVRIPVRWDQRTLQTAPYTVDAAWMDRVEQVVDWGLDRGLFITLNAHHEDWIKNSTTYDGLKARFDSIWVQIAERFKDKSDKLLFEIINEPTHIDLHNAKINLSIAQVNELNARILSIIRKTNPTRLVIFSGNNWSGPWDLVKIAVPNPADPYLMAYYHSYDPYLFGLEGQGTYGKQTEINKTKEIFDLVSKWSADNNIPVILSEFGAVNKCDYNSRMIYYATVTEMAINYGIPFNVWDDGGWFKMLDRSKHTWNDLKDIVIYTYKESPSKFVASLVNDSTVSLSWTNRTNLNDSIIVERKTSQTAPFSIYATIAPNAVSFYDSLLKVKTNYYYRIRSNIKDSIQIYSHPVTIKTMPTKVKALSNNNIFNIYPNPATEHVTVTSMHPNNVSKLEVFDIMGKIKKSIVLSKENETIELTGFSPGIYFFKIVNETNTHVQRIVVK